MQNAIFNRLLLLLFILLGAITLNASECTDCPGDFNHSHHVDDADVDILLSLFGTNCDGCCEDLDGNGSISSTDLSILLGLFGTQCDIECSCPGDLNWDFIVDQDDLYDVFLPLYGTNCTGCCSDLDDNGIVNAVDLSLLLSLMGATCPDCSCPGDFDESGYVDSDDLNSIIELFDQACDGCCEDLNEDGMVDILDVYLWIPLQNTNCNPEECDHCPGDFNFDLVVDDDDAIIMLNTWPTTCTGCCEDLDDDGDVDLDDIALFNNLMGNECEPDCGDCLGDFDFSLNIDQADLDIFLLAFGQACDNCCEDLNDDGAVNGGDLTIMLGLIGTSCSGMQAENIENRSSNINDEPIIEFLENKDHHEFSSEVKSNVDAIWVIYSMDGSKEILFGNTIQTKKNIASIILFEFDKKNTNRSNMTYKVFGNDSNSTNASILIYPNPSSSSILIESKEIVFNQLNSITITDVSGRLIQNYQYEISADGLQIETSNFENGTYVLSLEDDKGIISTEIFQVLK